MKRLAAIVIAAASFHGATARAQPEQTSATAASERPAPASPTESTTAPDASTRAEGPATPDSFAASPPTSDAAPADAPVPIEDPAPSALPPYASTSAPPADADAAARTPARDTAAESAAALTEPSTSPTPRTAVRPAALELAAGLTLVSRHFRYSDDVYGFMRPYTLPAGPAIAFDARWFPGSCSRNGIASAFGVEVRYDRSFGIQSERGGLRFPTAMRIVETNLLGRFARRGHEAIGVFGYGNQAFEFERTTPSTPDNIAVPDVPNVAYAYVKLGAEGRVRVHERVSVLAGAAYLFVFDSGGIATNVWFPHATTGGATFTARVAVRVTKYLEAQAGLEYRRYFLDMHSRIGDPFIAGGALDQYTLADVRLVFRL